MPERVVLASRQFKKIYPTFVEKYRDLENLFREFLVFRQTHRPDESFNNTDGRLSGSKVNRCHLIRGKAILIYQLHGSEIRLIAIVGTDQTPQGRDYAKGLSSDDFFMFDIDQVGSKQSMDESKEAVPEIVEETVSAAETVETPESLAAQPEPADQPKTAQPEAAKPNEVSATIAAPAADQSNDLQLLWADRIVQFARDRQLLYEPRPRRQAIVLKLDKDLMIPKGDSLVIDIGLSTVFHLTASETDVVFQPGRETHNLTEAIAIAMEAAPSPPPPPRQVVQRPVSAVQAASIVAQQPELASEQPELASEQPELASEQPELAEQPEVPNIELPGAAEEDDEFINKLASELTRNAPPRKARPLTLHPRQQDISAQVGRLLVVIGQLQEMFGTKRIDYTSILKHLDGQDASALKIMLVAAQSQNYVQTNGKKPDGRNYYYCLTPVGEQKRRLLGNFVMAGRPTTVRRAGASLSR